MKILLVGGGSGGPVSPLLAVAKQLKNRHPEAQFLWLGGIRGPEKNMVNAFDIPFHWIFSGKLRRYFSWRNFIDPIFIFIGFIQSIIYIKKWKPDVVIGAGSFIAVPTGIAAWFLRVPLITHQQDIKVGLANKILSYFSKTTTVSFETSLVDFSKKKAVLTGNPVREDILYGDLDRARQHFNLQADKPIILIIGGGTGALKINQLAIGALPELLNDFQVIHITGKGKKLPPLALKEKEEFYYSYEFLINEMPDALAAADIVITRAGIGFLSELSALKKATIIIPIPNTQQEDNAEYFSSRGAAVYLKQNEISSQSLVADIREMINDKQSLEFLSNEIGKLYHRDAADRIINEILKLINE